MKKVYFTLIFALLLSACAPADSAEPPPAAAETTTTTAATTTATTTTTLLTAPKDETTNAEDYEIYETAGISYHIPSTWKFVHTDNESKYYKKFKADDFSFSVQVHENFAYEISGSDSDIKSQLNKKFTKADAKNIDIYKINDFDCILALLQEKSDSEHFTLKLACQSKTGVVYFNIFDFPDVEFAKSKMYDFAQNISGNIAFPSKEEAEKTTTTTKKKKTTTEKTTTKKATTTKAPKTTSAPKTTTAEPTTTKPADIGSNMAIRSAQSYLSFMAFSRTGLIHQLEYEGYSHADAEYAADNCGANWTNQAAKKAQEYLSTQAFSRSGLIKQLEYEGFSQSDATYGTDAAGADWNQQAAKKAQDYISIMSFSRDGLIKQLEYEGFTAEQAAYGASAVGY